LIQGLQIFSHVCPAQKVKRTETTNNLITAAGFKGRPWLRDRKKGKIREGKKGKIREKKNNRHVDLAVLVSRHWIINK